MSTESEKQTIYLPLSRGLIDNSHKQDYEDDPLGNLHKNQTQLQFGQVFQDDSFKLVNLDLPKHIVVKRLKDILQIGSSIKQAKYIKQSDCSEILKNKYPVSSPSYLSQIKLIPEWHFQYLIEPQTVNSKGYYHVAVVKQGRIIKKTIDDYVYFNEHTRRIHSHPFLEDKPWIHIIVKAWAKMNRGYQNIPLAKPFSFIKAFTYPDWSAINPGLESVESILKRFSSSNKKDYIYIGKTKNSQKIGYFGLIPNCSSYLISGYYQQYGNVFIRIKSYVGDKWNGVCSQKPLALPVDNIQLNESEFIMPIQQFINVFHLIYFTSNKFNIRFKNFYNKLSLNLDARESKAKLIRIQVGGEEKNVEYSVNLNIYLPSVNTFDLANKREKYQEKLAIPYCKILLGRQLEQQINRQSSYADSMRQMMLNNEKGDFLALSNHKYEFVRGDYTLGYANEMTYHLKLKPGSYILRLKIQKLLPQYRALLNVTSNVQVKINQINSSQMQLVKDFLSQVLSHRARLNEKNIIYPTPSNKSTWFMINNDFNLVGYGSILLQMGKNDNRGLTVQINSQKLKEGGYRLKNKQSLIESKYKIYLKEKQSKILILKEDIEWKQGTREWIPEGIHLKFDHLPEKLQNAKQL